MKKTLLTLAAIISIAFSSEAVTNKSEPITPSNLISITFFGTEPFWDLEFSETQINLKTIDGEDIAMIYTKNGLALNYRLQEVMEYAPNNDIVVTALAKNKPAIITIKKEECNDGMTDNTYPYSITINWCGSINLHKGCGKTKSNKNLLEEERGNLEGELNELLYSLRNEEENANFFTNNIKEHVLYKKTDQVRALVDKLLGMGYGIEQAEGRYYLYIGEPNNYIDGETE